MANNQSRPPRRGPMGPGMGPGVGEKAKDFKSAVKRLVKELQNSINLSIELSDEGKNSEVSFLREALVFRNLGLEDIEKESISRKEEER